MKLGPKLVPFRRLSFLKDRLPIILESKIVRPKGMFGCWLWTAHVTSKGYGQINREGIVDYAHRVVYELLIGPIPKGLQLDHFRLNPGVGRFCSRSCVNPEHLELVTTEVNTLRGNAPSITKGSEVY